MKRTYSRFSPAKEVKGPEDGFSKGFTLIEVLVAMVIMSIVLASTYTVLISLRRSYTTQEVAAGVQQTGRMGIDFMVKDIRMAGLDPHNRADAGIENATPTSIRFTLDRWDVPIGGSGSGDSDGDVNDNSERITYSYDAAANELEQILYEATADEVEPQTLVDNVTNLAFTYLDEDGNPAVAADFSDIRAVVISMTVLEPAGRDGTVARTFNTTVRCRNLGL